MEIKFTKQADRTYSATIKGFSGVLQVDRDTSTRIVITVGVAGMKQVKLLEECTATTLMQVDLSADIDMNITVYGDMPQGVYLTE